VSRNTKGTPIAEQWGKVARWAGIGNNEDEGENGMTDETMVQAVDETDAVQAGVESGDAAAGLQGELEQVRGERDQLLDRLARLQAEFENARRRDGKERADLRDYAVQGAVEPFLGVMDNFQLALKSGGTAEQLRAGVELILKQMEEALRGLNVQAVETVGTQFDPRIHEALGSIETTEFPDHQVLEEIRKGYKIREKLLRPALVRIAANGAQVAE
jgi:molecular chaperone GrpE